MATSDPVITTIAPPASSTQRRAQLTRLDFVHRHPGLQVLMDVATASFGIWVTHLVYIEHFSAKGLSYSTFSVLGAAVITTIIFAVAGAYSRGPTPVNIAETEGLVRGTCYATILALMSCLYSGTALIPFSLLSGTVMLLFLLLQRDILHVLAEWVRRRNSDCPQEPVAGEVSQPQLLPILHDSSHTVAGLPAFATEITSIANTVLIADASQLRQEVCSLEERQRGWYAPDVVRGALVASESRDNGLPINLLLKRAIDIAGSFILLILLSPLFLLAAALVWTESGVPVFFRHRRIGEDAAPFNMWKFRSMRKEVPEYERSPASDSDPRLTRVGRSLRRFSIDELPQLINVLKGEMSLVGPRPEMPFIVEKYGAYERRRLRAKPGITGLWQISPARAKPIHESMEFDLFYIEHKNIFLDCAILLRTMTAVIRGVGAT